MLILWFGAQALSQFFSSCGTISDLASDDNGLTLQKNVFITFDSDATAAVRPRLAPLTWSRLGTRPLC